MLTIWTNLTILIFLSSSTFCSLPKASSLALSQPWQKNKASIMCSSMCHPDVSTSASVDLHVWGGILEFIKTSQPRRHSDKTPKKVYKGSGSLSCCALKYHRRFAVLCKSLGKETLFDTFSAVWGLSLPFSDLIFPAIKRDIFSNGLHWYLTQLTKAKGDYSAICFWSYFAVIPKGRYDLAG